MAVAFLSAERSKDPNKQVITASIPSRCHQQLSCSSATTMLKP
jgi:hypothetical protein